MTFPTLTEFQLTQIACDLEHHMGHLLSLTQQFPMAVAEEADNGNSDIRIHTQQTTEI